LIAPSGLPEGPQPIWENSRSPQKTKDESRGDDCRDDGNAASQPLTRITEFEASKYREASYCEGYLDVGRSHNAAAPV
jgi:hypothetical protein